MTDTKLYLCVQAAGMPLTVGHVYEGRDLPDAHLEVLGDNNKMLAILRSRFVPAGLDDAWNITHWLDSRVTNAPSALHEFLKAPKNGDVIPVPKFKPITISNPTFSAQPIKPTDQQVGGDHYKAAAIQPAVFAEKNKMTFLEGNVVKRVYRHSRGGKGREDLEKAIHELQLILELTYGGGLDA